MSSQSTACTTGCSLLTRKSFNTHQHRNRWQQKWVHSPLLLLFIFFASQNNVTKIIQYQEHSFVQIVLSFAFRSFHSPHLGFCEESQMPRELQVDRKWMQWIIQEAVCTLQRLLTAALACKSGRGVSSPSNVFGLRRHTDLFSVLMCCGGWTDFPWEKSNYS